MFKDEEEHALFDMYLWRTSRGDSFRHKLFDLMNKADAANLNKLTIAFPQEALAYKLWYNSPDEGVFLKQIKERFYPAEKDASEVPT